MSALIDYLPLGIRHHVLLSAEQRRALRILEQYDLSAVRQRILVEGSLPHALVDETITEFRRFLALTVVLGRPVGMISKQVDQVWHTCLLFSRLYADLCEQVFGHFVHHEPAGQQSVVGSVALDPTREAQSFEEAYEAVFGPLGRLSQWERLATTEQDIASLNGKLTAFARALTPGEQSAFEQLLALAAAGYEAILAQAAPAAA
jgi:hypothetical protein